MKGPSEGDPAGGTGKKGDKKMKPKRAKECWPSCAARENGRKGGRPALLWSHEGDWTSAKIFASPRGWRVETQSSIQGEWDGRVVFVPYSGRFPWGLDMEGSWNGSTTNGQALVHFCEQEAGSRVLKAGREVE